MLTNRDRTVSQSPCFFAPREAFFSPHRFRCSRKHYRRQRSPRRLFDPPQRIRFPADRGLSTWLRLRRTVNTRYLAGLLAVGVELLTTVSMAGAARPGAAVTPRHLLPDGRCVTPVGRIRLTPNFALGVAGMGPAVLVEAAGAGARHTVTVLSAANLKRLSQFAFFKTAARRGDQRSGLTNQSLFQGITTGPHHMIYVAGGFSDDVVALRLSDGRLHLVRRYALRYQPFPSSQYPYQYQGPHDQPYHFYPDSLALSPRGHYLYVTGLLSNSVARINLARGQTVYTNAGAYPFQVVAADAGQRLVISDWGANGVTVIKSAAMQRIGFIRLGPPTGPTNRRPGVHPTAMTLDGAPGQAPPAGVSAQARRPLAASGSARVWVACANSDRLSCVDSRLLAVVKIIPDQPYPTAPPGSFPDALAVHGRYLFVANSGNNDVAVFNRHDDRCLGLIPTGWYPTALAIHRHALYVATAKGLGSTANPRRQWIGDSMPGLIQRIPLTGLRPKLAHWTRQTRRDNGFTARQRARRAAANQRVAAFLHRHIREVVFILRENKTFDEDCGDYRRAGRWADPHLDLYGPRELPNLYALADRFALAVNFYVDGEVTAQGHQWTTAAEDSDFVQRTWPMYYSGRGLVGNPGWTQNLGRPTFHAATGLNGADDPQRDYVPLAALPPASNPWISYPGGMFLFNDFLRHHVSFEDFGEFVSRSEAGDIAGRMHRHICTPFPAWNRFILDTYRAAVVKRFIHAHAEKLPRFMYIWLPDDHTAGRTPGYYTPDYYVANNDLATGRIVAALSRTPQWRHMLIIVTEDDAQSGADHIDAHRSLAVLISPWIRPGVLITHRYSQVDLVRTVETICRVPPMSQWDANAEVMSGMWAAHPHGAPYHARPMEVPVAYNPGRTGWVRRLRRQAGQTGHWLSPGWLRAHGPRVIPPRPSPAGGPLSPVTPQRVPPLGAGAGHTPGPSGLPVSPSISNPYTPTTLLTIAGPEQLRQEWIAVKGLARYHALLAYLRRLGRQQHQPLSHYIAGDDDASPARR